MLIKMRSLKNKLGGMRVKSVIEPVKEKKVGVKRRKSKHE